MRPRLIGPLEGRRVRRGKLTAAVSPRWRRRFAAACIIIGHWFLIGRQNEHSRPHHAIRATAPNIILDGNSSRTKYPEDELVQICGISVMFGDYEKTAKEPVEPLAPSFPLFLVTDQEHLLRANSNSSWTRVRLNESLWQEDCVKPEFVGANNNPCEQPFLFNLAKFYKMQFYRVPQIQEAGCNVVVWLDATLQITASLMGRMADRAERGQNFVVFVQDGPRKGFQTGKVVDEAKRSKFGKYGGNQPGSFGPRQNVEEQYQRYLAAEGFREQWFENATWLDEYKGVGNDSKYGLYITCMVLFDLRRAETKPFLDCWWKENILGSTQDQVGFPYCAFKLKTRIHALPDSEEPTRWDPFDEKADSNPYFRKLRHGL